jgi:hypothetical protein
MSADDPERRHATIRSGLQGGSLYEGASSIQLNFLSGNRCSR